MKQVIHYTAAIFLFASGVGLAHPNEADEARDLAPNETKKAATDSSSPNRKHFPAKKKPRPIGEVSSNDSSLASSEAVSEAKRKSPLTKEKPCSSPFGTELGNAHGVVGYSNCNTDTISRETSSAGGQESGMKWQCVEYARRYMQQKLGFTFGDVHGAQNLWFMTRATQIAPKGNEPPLEVPFMSVENGTCEAPPAIGSLLIYPLSEDCPFGHVAVVVDVDKEKETLYVAEQNWDNKPWSEKAHSRQLTLEKNASGKYVITDKSGLHVLGWKTIGVQIAK